MSGTEPSADTIVRALSQYIADEVIGDGVAVEPEENLLMDGLVDSLGMFRLVSHVESLYEVKIPPDQFTVENFRNLDTIGRYVESLLTSNSES